ncbi:hypothetical protein [Bradyrhizobium sp. AUGA SZCCT0160]|jgi:hypothetical protein|uniref:hypothetical protein n=1 Tax=Bradyrhizobium sp. AUGA SZCCT0160 TaxID=2807662 RepID=UPI001BA82F09|nr:hypothetical protein [Bradyrhizobium sp. AUGA SZCCT0160]MBR1187260.1 hypothetical protein [Bradyrhizobium sp. AUGA SZCCT0160]
MMKHSPVLFLLAAASFVVWLVAGFGLDADLLFGKADATTSPAISSSAPAPEPLDAAHTANRMTTRILELDQEKRLAFWASVLKNRKQACRAVVLAMYQGGTESGVDSWNIGCRDGNKYSISIGPGARGFEAESPVSVCNGNTFARRAE